MSIHLLLFTDLPSFQCIEFIAIFASLVDYLAIVLIQKSLMMMVMLTTTMTKTMMKIMMLLLLITIKRQVRPSSYTQSPQFETWQLNLTCALCTRIILERTLVITCTLAQISISYTLYIIVL